MRKNPVRSQTNGIINHQTVSLLQLESNLKKKFWLWTPLVVTLVIIMLSVGLHFNTTTFIFAPLLSFSFGYWFFSVKRLVVCTRFLKLKIKNKPTSCLKQKSVSPVLKIMRQCLYQFCFANSFIFFAAIVFSVNQSGYLFHHFLYNVMLLLIFSSLIYVVSLFFSHAQLTALLGHPVVSFLGLPKPIHEDLDPLPIYTGISDGIEVEPDKIRKIHDETNENIWEEWMHDPVNPASAEYQTSIWNKRHWDDH